jgi:hypothetical protein
MVCVDTDDDEDFGLVWQCECGWWNDEDLDECYKCWRFWE